MQIVRNPVSLRDWIPETEDFPDTGFLQVDISANLRCTLEIAVFVSRAISINRTNEKSTS